MGAHGADLGEETWFMRRRCRIWKCRLAVIREEPFIFQPFLDGLTKFKLISGPAAPVLDAGIDAVGHRLE